MDGSILHIVHGDGLLDQMQALILPGKKVVWRELLCEGTTVRSVGSNHFNAVRKSFLEGYYNIPKDIYENRFLKELNKLERLQGIEEINLWFEFDLYNHINMIALISFLLDNGLNAPVFLVCSRHLAGDGNGGKGLARLNAKQLKNHFDQRINLTPEDLEYASLIWSRYCAFDHKKLQPEIQKPTNFEYLSSCMKAHLERFPNRKNGINSMEKNVLRLIDEHNICNEAQLLGYALEYQGYYGYSFEQMERLIEQLEIFYDKEETQFLLNENGKSALANSKNFYRRMQNDLRYGGAGKFDFLYDPDSHNLMKL